MAWRRKDTLAGSATSLLETYQRYKVHLPDQIESYRIAAARYRRLYNTFQALVIVGSVTASTLTAALADTSWARWITVTLTLLVSIAATLSTNFNLRERSNNLQRVADEIEHHYRAVELRLGEYRDVDESTALRALAEHVEGLRLEQGRRERELNQPPDLRQAAVGEASSAGEVSVGTHWERSAATDR